MEEIHKVIFNPRHLDHVTSHDSSRYLPEADAAKERTKALLNIVIIFWQR